MDRPDWARGLVWLAAAAAIGGQLAASRGQDCQAPSGYSQPSQPAGYGNQTCGCQHCAKHCGHKHCRHCCSEIPHGVILPSAPALYFGASTLSVLPAGYNPQAFGTPNRLSDADLLQLLRLMQNQSQGFSSPSCSAPGTQGTGTQGTAAPVSPGAPPAQGTKSPYSAGTPVPLSLESRLQQVETEVRELQTRVQEHTEALARIIQRDPVLMKQFQVDPNAPPLNK